MGGILKIAALSASATQRYKHWLNKLISYAIMHHKDMANILWLKIA